MTKREALIFTAYTNFMFIGMSDYHEFVEDLLQRPVLTHEFASKDLTGLIKDRVTNEFLQICNSVSK